MCDPLSIAALAGGTALSLGGSILQSNAEASANDRFVALDLLKNASIAAGFVLPGCQDTGTAIIKGKRGQFVFTGGGDEAAHVRSAAI